MRRFVETYNEVVGFHRYPNAPEFCSYLQARHRHVFVIRCLFEVEHNEREIEINKKQEDIRKGIHHLFGTPAEFGTRSCESIAELVMEMFNADSVKVLEDGYGGATLTK